MYNFSSGRVNELMKTTLVGLVETCMQKKIIFHEIDVPGPLLRRDDLWFDFCKRPPSVSDHLVFAFWVVAYGGVECR